MYRRIKKVINKKVTNKTHIGKIEWLNVDLSMYLY